MSTIDLIQAAAEQKPVEFQDAFASIMQTKIAERIDALVPEVSNAMFAPSEE